jgi:TRAP-type C4-dicarboxylate transport system permease small subunit
VLDDFNARLVRVLLAAAALLIFLLSFLVVADVIGRAVFNSPVKGTPELVSMSIVIICFLLAGYSVQSGGMIHADILISMFGVRGQAFAQLLSAVLGILFFGLIVWGSFEPAMHAWTSGEYEGEGALRVPVWPARVVVLAGSVLVVVTYLLNAARAARAMISGAPYGQPAATSRHLRG